MVIKIFYFWNLKALILIVPNFWKKMNMKNLEIFLKKKNYFLFFPYINLVNLSLRLTKTQIHGPKIYKTNRHWTWFSYVLKPNTKVKPRFSAPICNQTQNSTHILLYFLRNWTQNSTHILLYFLRNRTQNSKYNEQNPIFSQTHERFSRLFFIFSKYR